MKRYVASFQLEVPLTEHNTTEQDNQELDQLLWLLKRITNKFKGTTITGCIKELPR